MYALCLGSGVESWFGKEVRFGGFFLVGWLFIWGNEVGDGGLGIGGIGG